MLLGAIGVVVVGQAFLLSRSGQTGAVPQTLYWLGLAVIVAPTALRLLSLQPSRNERLMLVTWAGVCLYGIKVLHAPTTFLYADEFVHQLDAQHIAATGQLFGPNALLPISGHYPGLEIATQALREATGLSIFTSGMIVVGAARVLLMVAAFLLFERISGSDRLAGLAVLLYGANPNFLYWSAQYSYESLALPLMLVVLLAVVTRDHAPASQRRGWTVIAVLATDAVVATHHLTTFALLAALVLTVGLGAMQDRRRKQVPVERLWPSHTPQAHSATHGPPSAIAAAGESRLAGRPRTWRGLPLDLLAVTAAGAVTWTLLAASGTVGYLGAIFRKALVSMVTSVHGGGRAPFSASPPGSLPAPVIERVLGVLSVLVIVVAVLTAVLKAPRRTWRHNLGQLLVWAGVLFVATYALRVAPGAWETANRSSEFLFLGAGLLIAISAIWVADRTRKHLVGLAIVAVLTWLLFAGGSVLGWQPSVRLAPPVAVRTSAGVIRPQSFAVADWAAQAERRHAVFVADDVSARLIAVRGVPDVLPPGRKGVPELLSLTTLPTWLVPLLGRERVDYVVLDRRLVSADNLAGYYFQPPAARGPESLRPPAVRSKFERLSAVRRVYDSGDIVVEDLREWRR